MQTDRQRQAGRQSECNSFLQPLFANVPKRLEVVTKTVISDWHVLINSAQDMAVTFLPAAFESQFIPINIIQRQRNRNNTRTK
jgi:hypothetical protein